MRNYSIVYYNRREESFDSPRGLPYRVTVPVSKVLITSRNVERPFVTRPLVRTVKVIEPFAQKQTFPTTTGGLCNLAPTEYSNLSTPWWSGTGGCEV